MKRNVNFALYILPTLILFLIVYAVPLVVLFGTSFGDWRTGGSISFAGIKNYVQLILHDETFQEGFKNNVLWILLQGTVNVAIGTVFALILARRPFFWKFARTVYMLPSIISSAAMGMLFVCVFNPQFGMVNSIIRLFNPSFSHNWFMAYDTAFATVTFTWLPYAGMVMLLILTEVSSMDHSIIEAAIVDGADQLQMDLRIILPNLKNIIGTCVILETTQMLKKLDIIMLTTRGGPGSTTMNLPMFIYKTSMVENNFGLANAAGVLLTLLGCLTVLIINNLFRIGEEK
ncbi:permease component of ABC-type sugar transporter [Sphaerochaeta pleomorpha str. Grapes]|uniref:Permease component of ABC-type sugar transporter n=1 Tax=Sphaerochaeta pleomorpha (strain ATCC BAA-1885 / DSM 22778 / Grapes) TaxID=158190 RepID=G8QTF0_SPHPG|nr:sugar ABC transporter permease [Sphaerochaeta pleomorpha]AEV30191.1 permease component of ABC-type sugar transporter [Sphaerochaeta pleomorpha str. Grapes]